MNLNIFVSKTDYTKPEEYGFVDISVMEKCRDFVLMLTNPFARLDLWINTSVIHTRDITIVAPKYEPCSNELSTVAKFCKTHHIKFMGSPLTQNNLNNYVKLYGCTFVNVSDVLTQPKLLLVDIPDNVDCVEIPNNSSIIGVSTNTVDFKNIKYLSVPGKLYGSFAKYYDKSCIQTYGRVIYMPQTKVNTFDKILRNSSKNVKEILHA